MPLVWMSITKTFDLIWGLKTQIHNINIELHPQNSCVRYGRFCRHSSGLAALPSMIKILGFMKQPVLGYRASFERIAAHNIVIITQPRGWYEGLISPTVAIRFEREEESPMWYRKSHSPRINEGPCLTLQLCAICEQHLHGRQLYAVRDLIVRWQHHDESPQEKIDPEVS